MRDNKPMDWFTWLSRTGLDPSLVYDYALTFTDNELGEDDVSYFNHEVLQSMGISVAKHRLEILKPEWQSVKLERPRIDYGQPKLMLTYGSPVAYSQGSCSSPCVSYAGSEANGAGDARRDQQVASKWNSSLSSTGFLFGTARVGILLEVESTLH